MNHRSTITLSRKAFSHNISVINALTGYSSCAIVVKSNAYGHGMIEMARMAESEQGVSWICTAGIEEALTLRAQGISKPLLVLSYLDGDIQQAIKKSIQVSVCSFEEAIAVSMQAVLCGQQALLHIKIDTGMGRLGLMPDKAVALIKRMSELPFITIVGIFTHFSDTGHSDTSYCQKQLEVFDQLLDDLAAANIVIPFTHVQSSSSLNLAPRTRYSFLRVGASMYGLWKTPIQKAEIQKRDPAFDLIPVLQWRSTITAIKSLPLGSPVGYGRTFITTRPTKIALIPVGYWDGYSHLLSNKGVALLHGYTVPVAGVVSMNIAAFDITDVPDAQVGDELILIGNAPSILPHEIARRAGIITNVLMTSLNSLVPRTVVAEHVPLLSLSELDQRLTQELTR